MVITVSTNSASWPLFTGLQSPTGALIRFSRQSLEGVFSTVRIAEVKHV
jgi:hypothetical protein